MAGSWVLNGSRHMLQASSELSSKAAEDDGVEMCDIVRVRGKGEKLGFEKIKDCEESDDTQRYADVSVVLDSAKVALCKTFRGQVYI